MADLRCATADDATNALSTLTAATLEGKAFSVAAKYRDDTVTVYGYRDGEEFIPVAIAMTEDIAKKMKPQPQITIAKDGKRG